MRPCPRTRTVGIAALLALVVSAPGSPAVAKGRISPIPGLTGRALRVAGVVPLADGGALIAATVTRHSGRHVATRVAVARLRFDGAVDLAFGHWGVAFLRNRAQATSVAADRRTGRSFIGIASGRGRTGAIVALDGRGRLVRGFGRRGVLRLRGRAARDAPTALALSRTRLFAATGARPCRGCLILALARRSGRSLAHVTAVPVDAGGACGRARVSALAAADGLVLIAGSGGARCPARLLARTTRLRVARRAGPGAIGGLGDGVVRTLAMAGPGRRDACLAVQGRRSLGLAPVAPGRLAGERDTGPRTDDGPPRRGSVVREAPRPASPGELRAVASVGRRGCGALVQARRTRRSYVVTVGRRARGTGLRAVPARLHPAGMFPCRGRIVVVGVLAGRRRADAALAVLS